MKKFSTLIIISCIYLQVSFGQLTISPKYPSPGDVITLTYDLENSILAASENFDITLYVFGQGEEPTAYEIAYQRTDDQLLKATFSTNEKTKLVSVILSDRDDDKLVDSRDKKGYQKMMYHDEKPTQGAYYQKAMLKNRWSGLIGLDRDQEKAAALIAKEIEYHGDLSDEQNMNYLRILAKVDMEIAKNIATASIAKLSDKKRMEESDLISIKSYYDIVKNTEESEAIAKKLKKKFPKGKFVNQERINAFFDTKDWSEKIELYSSIDETILDKQSKSTIAYMASNIGKHFAEEGNWEMYNKYISKVENKSRLASTYNSLAWKMSGESIEATPHKESVKKALELSNTSLELLDGYYQDETNKPAYYTAKRWRKGMDYSKGMYSDTYALLAYHDGNMEDALKYQQASCELSEFSDPGMNERYSTFYEKVHGPKATGLILEGLIKEGKASSQMKDQLRTIFMDHYSKEDAFNKYMVELEKESKRKLIEKLMKEIMDEESPAFVLKNLDGQEVSLESLQGKVVVLDFWATWCGPCIASFPGMKTAVDKYKNDPEVAFLFIDTWESEENKEENASKFMKDNEYNFNVLMDNENKVVSSFKVAGIPTKFILGKDQRIRFKSVGFSGSDEKLVNELTTMIEYLKQPKGKKVKVSMAE